ncbi:putative outer membrane protein, probably involved in nutrient binding [Parabacteroides distasonis ATCC 8503]|uniref:Putative outer membrane protein, probably involved in nutrient binding n=2 Tax=Parabacteroides distasonis TaxID=823 RepID=A6LHW9_PARD8|nr:putative outer membrane protein, probably involved in nutrient binding [Parabacteroides distasonis ATCC 8503]
MMLCLYEKIKLLSRLCFLIYTLNSNFMSNVVFWRQVFLGASLFLCDGYPIIAAEVGDLTPNVGTRSLQQDGRRVICTISDKAGPIVGANVLVKGTTIGNISDMDGRVILDGVPSNAILVVSYIGYVSQEIPLKSSQTNVRIQLVEDTQALDEVVVVGYGTQSKKDITGSVAVVSTDAIHETPVATFAEALQGKASGVYISNSGGPSGETTIRIRGVGSLNSSDPLIVVDGVSGVDISSVNPNDIESMQVLKDASATAIYGAQGANGVIIITTKQGTRADRVRVSYNGYFGVAKMANSGYDLLNGWESMEFEELGQQNLYNYRGLATSHPQFGQIAATGGKGISMPYAIKPAGYSEQQIIDMYGSVEAWEKSYVDDGSSSWARSAYYQMLADGYSDAEARKGTNWYDEIVQTGKIQDHQISLVGGGEKATYSVSLGYTNREGTIQNSYFKRYSLRTNTTYNPNKYFTMGQNTNLAAMETGGESGRQGDANTFAKTYTMNSWVPIYNVGGDYTGSVAPNAGRDISAVHQVAMNENDWTRMFHGQTAVFAELSNPWIEGLKLRSQFSARLNGMWSLEMTERQNMANKEASANNTLTETGNWRLNWQWTNTATYTKKIHEDHNITVVLGTEAIKQGVGRYMQGTRIDYIFESDPNTWTLDNGSSSNIGNSSRYQRKVTMFGLFGRADYSYKGKYLATFTIRRDASSKFGSKNRWGNFPSASLGWRMSDEKFMEPTRKWLDDFKLRAGYGTTGNSNIGSYNYAFQYGTGNYYMYPITGSDSETSPGYVLSNLGDSDAKWETTKMFNIGFDLTALSNRLTAGFDFYVKNTSDLLVPANWSALVGNASKPSINIGDMKNRGVDLSIGWRDKVGEFGYNITANISRYKNELTRLGSSDLFNDTRLSKVNITTVGQPVGMFYGYQIEGIYQNEQDVISSGVLPYGVATENDLVASAWVGRYKMKDVNNDGKIDADDRTIIGNPHPDLTGGFNISLTWRDFDLSTYMYYSIGNDLYKHYEYYTMFGNLQSNYSKDRLAKSWDPVNNPNGIYPLWTTTSTEGPEAGNESNSNYVQDGSYLRMQTLTLGYSLPKKLLKKIGFEKIRVYGQISNVFTITGYDGLDPEVRSHTSFENEYVSSDMNKGIDYGSYGMPRQFLMGVNVTF